MEVSATTTSAPPAPIAVQKASCSSASLATSGSERQPYSPQVAKPAKAGGRTSTRRRGAALFCPPKSCGDVDCLPKQPCAAVHHSAGTDLTSGGAPASGTAAVSAPRGGVARTSLQAAWSDPGSSGTRTMPAPPAIPATTAIQPV